MFIKEKVIINCVLYLKKMDQSGGMDMVRVAIYIIRCLVSFTYTTGSLLRSDGGKVNRNERVASIFCLVSLSIYVTMTFDKYLTLVSSKKLQLFFFLKIMLPWFLLSHT